MEITSRAFKENANRALHNPVLQKALEHLKSGAIEQAAACCQRPARVRSAPRAAPATSRTTRSPISTSTSKPTRRRSREAGGEVHYAETGSDARDIILDICRSVGARTVTKGKSMIAEEIGLNEHLEANGIEPVETDLGEYIIQLRHEAPSHIIAPAVHLNQDQVEADFRRVHTHLPPERDLSEPTSLLAEARAILRERFLAADVGITGANFLVAETGTSIIVTNEGNGDLTQILPRVHIVIASIEKIVPTLEDVCADPARCSPARRPARTCRSTRPSRPARAGPTIPTGQTSITSSFSTTAAPRCSAPSSRTCCAASAAAPA